MEWYSFEVLGSEKYIGKKELHLQRKDKIMVIPFSQTACCHYAARESLISQLLLTDDYLLLEFL